VENLTVNDVYGEALYEAAASLGKTDEFIGAVRAMRDTFREQPDFLLLLRMPSIAQSERKELAAKAFDGRVSPELINFINILIDKRRVGQFEGISKAFEKKADAVEGVSKGRIESAVEISADQLSRFEEETGRLLHRKVKLDPTVDARLIGGVRIYVDGKLIDASIRRKLDDLKEEIRGKR
jgi:ATP synthase F1 delta subunit